ncbi:hypothetical protein F4560_004045 [Saccharothrix ecbatanensis]|uniref:Uncharacterized protein n=1 Tax=Saccharothrix ecbatanensis TaxID=1105145 RepID=A0A7W9HL23_9PSEU|nr:hypothetical protein [Saccharothrix ecbatanensis]MBB5804277.1 hypothetical protein [Saccharothrix ecbatanensis]
MGRGVAHAARGVARVGVGLVAGAAGSWFGGVASTHVAAVGLFLVGAVAVGAAAAVSTLFARRVFARATVLPTWSA